MAAVLFTFTSVMIAVKGMAEVTVGNMASRPHLNTTFFIDRYL